MYKKILITLAITQLAFTNLKAQDIIHLKNEKEIKAVIEEVGSTAIKFRKYAETDQGSYSIKKSDVTKINYENGDVQNFGANERIIIKKVVDDGEENGESSMVQYSRKTKDNGTYGKKVAILSFGYGVASQGMTDIEANLFDLRSMKHTGPIYLRYEHGISENIGIGLNVSYTLFKYKDDDFLYHRLNSGLMGWYHFNSLINVKNLDLYLGAGFDIGVRIAADEDLWTKFIPTIRGGARYYLGKSFALYSEIGYDQVGIIQAGISFGFNKN